MRRWVRFWPAIAVWFTLVSCGADATSEASATAPAPSEAAIATSSSSAAPASTGAGSVQACADVIDGTIQVLSGGSFRFDATVRSGDTGWDKYADAWEVRQVDGTVLGVRVLAHPHETEQPFTRSLSPVDIPPDVDQVVVAASDSVNGFCGETLTLDVPR